MKDRNALSYWFPRLREAGLPVPKTHLIEMPLAAAKLVYAVLDGLPFEDRAEEAMATFMADIAFAAEKVGWPCFIRTSHTSGKHRWKRTCHLPSFADMPPHVMALAEESMMADLPWHEWAIRELLPTKPFGVCPAYGNMPICREFRFFVEDGEAVCWHPYWPREALARGGANLAILDYEALCRMDNEAELTALAEAAGRALPGDSWSVDLLETERGWFITDMAEAGRSFHWPGCEKAARFARPGGVG